MRKKGTLRRYSMGVLLAATGVVAGLAFWEPLVAQQVAPPAARAYKVEIVRDGFGVPHILGDTDADAAYGLAFAHAEDDFATIQEVLAMTRGRAATLLGMDGAGIDFALHLLDARKTAEQAYPKMPEDLRAVIDAYAAGLNRYAEKHADEVRLSGLFPVNGEDVVAGFVLRAPFFFGLDDTIKALVGDKEPPRHESAALTPAGRDPRMNGSNAFAVAPMRMADGKTWLISNSHQPYEGGVAWYEAVVHSREGMDMAGALFPGSPFVLLGHNRHLGWTNTVNLPDLVDVYKLTLDETGKNYRFDGAWKPLQSERIWLKVRFGPLVIPVPRTIYHSVQGPVIVNNKGAFAFRYAGIGSARNLEQYYRIQKARNWDEWRAAMSLGGIQSTNFIYADQTGRIAYFYNALFPARQQGFDYSGTLPGDTSRDLWSGNLPFDRVPAIVDPPSGFVVNSNNTPFIAAGPGSELDPKDFSPLLGIEKRVTNRIVRAMELLTADPKLTPEELLAIKFDTAYSRNSYVGPWMSRVLAIDPGKDRKLAEAIALLKGWDWNSDGKGAADTLAEIVVRPIHSKVFDSTLDPDPRTELKKAVDHLMKHFGRLDVPLAEMQRLQRGKMDLPMMGGTDTLRAATIWERMPDGRGRVKHGDSFIMLVNWDKAGKVSSQTIQPYGAATTRPGSTHYTDQMPLFVKQRFKPVHFEWADAVAHASRRYAP